MNHKLRSILSCAALLLVSLGTSAEEALKHSYGVVSLIGDKIEVVTRRMATGSNIDRNERQSFPIPDGVFDTTALLAAQASIKEHGAGARAALYGISAPAMFENQEQFFDGERVQLPEALLAALRKDGLTRLVLITKHRAPANLRVGTESFGSGYLAGLGFYLDHTIPMIRWSTGETAEGLLAPFLYAKVTLIDITSLTVVRSAPVRANRATAPIGVRKSANTWDALTPAQKVQTLKDLIADEVPKAIETILQTGTSPSTTVR